MRLTADRLHARVLRKCFWKESTAKLTQAEILEIADEVILGEFYPLVQKSQGDFYLITEDTAIVAEQTRYRQPARSLGTIRQVLFVDAEGDETELIELDGGVTTPGKLTAVIPSGVQTQQCKWYFDGDYVALWPPPQVSEGYLRIRYPRAPNALTLLSNCGQIIDIDYHQTILGLGDFTFFAVDTDLDAIHGSAADVDVIGAGNAHQVIQSFAANLVTIAAVNTVVVDTSSGLDTSAPAIGDYVALEGFTPIVQLPDNYTPALLDKIAAECLDTVTETELALRRSDKAAAQLEQIQSGGKPRSEQGPRYVVNHSSPLRAGVGGRLYRSRQ